jgi:hypothetical protein
MCSPVSVLGETVHTQLNAESKFVARPLVRVRSTKSRAKYFLQASHRPATGALPRGKSCRPGHNRRYAIDASKLERELGWRALESFESGLKKTVKWYIDRRDGGWPFWTGGIRPSGSVLSKQDDDADTSITIGRRRCVAKTRSLRQLILVGNRQRRERGTVRHFELRIDVMKVNLDGPFCKIDAAGYLLVGHPFDNQNHDLLFPW